MLDSATTGTNIDLSNSSAGGINWLLVSNGSGAIYGPAGSFTLRDNTGTINALTALKTSGNVGIGTTAPGYKLEVNGSVNATSYYVGGSLMGSLGAGSITGQTLYWNGSAWTANVNLFNNNTNVGIGTTAPGGKLEVEGGNIIFDSTGTQYLLGYGGTQKILATRNGGTVLWSGGAGGLKIDNAANTLDLVKFHDSGGLSVGSSYVSTDPGAGNVIVSGNVGIGTTNPGDRLALVNNGLGTAFTGSSLASPGLTIDSGITSGAYTTNGINFTSNTKTAFIYNYSSSTAASNLIFGTNGTEAVRIDRYGNVGIGTTAPNTKLELYTSSGRDELRVSSGANYGFMYNDGATHIGGSGNFYFDNSINMQGTYGIYSIGSAQSSIDNAGNLKINGAGPHYFSSGNVGIGTTAPGALLHVVGPDAGAGVDAISALTVTGGKGGSSSGGNLGGPITLTAGNGGTGTVAGSGGSGGSITLSGGNGGMGQAAGIGPGGDVKLTGGIGPGGGINGRVLLQPNGGNVGIGTTAPGYKLEVNGSVNATSYYVGGSLMGSLGAGSITGQTLYWNGSAWTANTTLFNNNTNVGIGTTAPGAKLAIGSGQIFAAQGTNSSPSYSFSLTPNSGFYAYSAGEFVLTSTGVTTGDFYSGIARWYGNTYFSNTSLIGWTPGSPAYGNPDVSISRLGVGRLGIGIPGTSDYAGTLIAGNVGIGTTAPGKELSIQGSAGAGISLTSLSTNQSSGTGVDFYNTNVDDVLGYVQVGSTKLAAGTGGNFALDIVKHDATWASGMYFLRIQSNTNDITFNHSKYGANSGTYGNVIVANGNVGIGTTAPLADLHISRNVAAPAGVEVDNNNGGGWSYFQATANSSFGAMQANGSSTVNTGLWSAPNSVIFGSWGGATNGIKIVTNDSGAPIIFATGGGAFSNERMRINGSGNVGIGTTNPGSKLQVVQVATAGNDVGLNIDTNAGAYSGVTQLSLTATTNQPAFGIYWYSNPYASDFVKQNGNLRFGVQSASAITFSMPTYGEEKMRITPSGGLALGYTADPGAGSAIISGNVGIGTTSPISALTVNNNNENVATFYTTGGNSDTSITIGSNTANGGEKYMAYQNVTTGSNAWMAGMDDDESFRIAYGASGEIDDSKTKFMIQSNGYVGIGCTVPNTNAPTLTVWNGSGLPAILLKRGSTATNLLISYDPSGTLSSSNVQYDVGLGYSLGGTDDIYSIYTNDGSNKTPRLSVIKTGNVGIGTTNPGAKLEVNGASTFRDYLSFYANTTTAGFMGSANSMFTGYSVSDLGIRSIGKLYLGTNNDAATAKLTIDTNGNVGIGTTSPTHLFQTNGSVSDYIGYFYNSSTNVAAAGLYVRSDGPGNLLTLNYAGSDVLTVSQAQTTINNPVNFASAGDVSYAYDLYLTNATAGYIKFNGPGYVQTESPYANLDLTLRAANAGKVVVDDDFQTVGNVGIGTASTGSILTVQTPGAGNASLYVSSNAWGATLGVGGGSSASSLYINHGTGTIAVNQGMATPGGMTIWNNADPSIYFNAGWVNYINNAYNVGIGTSAPGAKLEISTPGYAPTLRLNGWGSGAYYSDIALNASSIDGSSTRLDFKMWDYGGLQGAAALSIEGQNGNVGIGTTAPVTKLDVYSSSNNQVSFRAGAGTSSYLSIAGNGTTPLTSSFDLMQGAASEAYVWNRANQFIAFGTNNTEKMRLSALGYVGIGTTAPARMLEVSGNGNSPYVMAGIGDTRFSASAPDFPTGQANQYGLSVQPMFNQSASSSDLNALFVAPGVTSANSSAIRDFVGVHIRPLLKYNSASVSNAYGLYVENPTIGSKNVSAYFEGNVGIGTTSPNYSLQIYSTSASTDRRIQLSDATSGAGTTDGLQIIKDANQEAYLVNYENAGMHFYTNTTERMTILAGGNVGIGTTNPGSSLQIGGSGSSFTAGITFKSGNSSAGMYLNSQASLILGTANVNVITINNNQSVGIGTTGPDSALDVIGTIQASNMLGGATTVSTDASGNIIRTPSDAKLKESIVPIEDPLSKVLALRGVTYYFKDKERFGANQQIGFIAQDVEKIIPQVVTSGGEYKSLNYQNLTAVLAGAIQQQQGMINTQGAAINDQQNQITDYGLQITKQTSDVSELQTAVNEKLNVISGSLASTDSKLAAGEVAFTSLKTQLDDASAKLEEQEKNLLAFETSTNDLLATMMQTENMLTEKVLEHSARLQTAEDRIKALEDKMAAAPATVVTVAGGAGEMPKNVVTADTTGNVVLAGIFKTKEIQAEVGTFKGALQAGSVQADTVAAKDVTADGVVAGSFSVKTGDDSVKKTIGDGVILKVVKDDDGDGVDDVTGSDGKSIFVKNETVKKDSRIFVTANTMLDQPLVVTGIKEGEGFKVEKKSPTNQDIDFSWWIVGEK